MQPKHSVAQFPETRESPIVQVKDPENRVAWEQFVSIYRPVIFRTAVARGMQEPDTQDLSQQVLLAVASAIGLSNQAAAAALGKTVGTIYTARCRIMQRLRVVIAELETSQS